MPRNVDFAGVEGKHKTTNKKERLNLSYRSACGDALAVDIQPIV
jgi:hypothetical protein